jgi:hypothetical protein
VLTHGLVYAINACLSSSFLPTVRGFGSRFGPIAKWPFPNETSFCKEPHFAHVPKTLKNFQSFGRLQLFGLRFVFPKSQSFGRPPVLAIPALTVLILTMWTVANGPGTHLQRSSTAKRKIVSQGDSANAAAVSV